MKKENGEKKIEKVTVLNLEVLEKCERIKVEKYFLASPPNISRVAQRKRAGPITQRSMDRNHPLLVSAFSELLENKCENRFRDFFWLPK